MVKVTSDSIILSSTLTQKKKMGLTGSIGMWVGSSPPAGALFCDGTTYNTADYPGLAASLGESGATFIIPDLRTRMPLGTTSDIRQTGGTATIQGIGHQHTADTTRFPTVSNSVEVEFGNGSWAIPFENKTASGVTTSPNTTEPQIDYLPPYLAVNFIIYT
jgi:microcystin-dependent protein